MNKGERIAFYILVLLYLIFVLLAIFLKNERLSQLSLVSSGMMVGYILGNSIETLINK